MRKPFDVLLSDTFMMSMLFTPLIASLPIDMPCPEVNVALAIVTNWVAAGGMGWLGSWYCGGSPDLSATSSSPEAKLTFEIATLLDETTSTASVFLDVDGALSLIPTIATSDAYRGTRVHMGERARRTPWTTIWSVIQNSTSQGRGNPLLLGAKGKLAYGNGAPP